MADDTGYQGWRTYETWLVKLWLDNTANEHRYWLARTEEIARVAVANVFGSMTAERVAVYALQTELREAHEEAAPELEGVWADLLSSAMESVDWREIAESMLDELRQPTEEGGTP